MGVIFDQDNTLVMSEGLWPEIDEQFFVGALGASHWAEWRPRWCKLKAEGRPLDQILEELRETYGLASAVAEIKQSREEVMFDVYSRELKPRDGAPELLEWLAHTGRSVAVASGMSPRVIRFVLRSMGWDHWVKAIASTHEVGRSKPDPSVFLLAARRLGLDPKECTAIENELTGHQAAVRAGMRCYLVPDSEERRRQAEAAGVTCCDSLAELYGLL